MAILSETVLNAKLVKYDWSDARNCGEDFYIDLNGIHVKIDKEHLEKVMLKTGVGEVIWSVDWKKIGDRWQQPYAITPHIKELGLARGVIFKTKVDAETAIKRELDKRIAQLKELGGE